MTLRLGDSAPEFTLPGADGSDHTYAPGAASVVIFTCNHCPYALAWEERLLAAGRDYGGRGVKFFAINPNDANLKPADSFEAMKQRVLDNPWPFPYLRDEDQSVATAYGALTTPDVFVFNSANELIYRGAPDGDYEDETQDARWLRGALDAALTSSTPTPAETKPVGCSVKWKP